MVRTVLTVNSGSSSLKVSLLQQKLDDCLNPDRILTAVAERLGQDEAFLNIVFDIKYADRKNSPDNHVSDCHSEPMIRNSIKQARMTHGQALVNILLVIRDLHYESDSTSLGLLETIVAVGHRVVHGGQKFISSVIVDDEAINEIDSLSHLAPLHNPANILGIKMMQEILPSVPSVAVFDTSFHCTIPPRASTYPLPKNYREDLEIKRYGFHGTSVKYVVQKASNILRKKHASDREHWNLIVAHLGNGASVTAIYEGKSVDTTMGFTPLEGVMMGTRSGSIDPAIVSYVCRQTGETAEDVTRTLNQLSGLKGVSDGDSDMRSVLDRASKGDKVAALAVEMFVYILAKHIAAMSVPVFTDGEEQRGIDAIVFSAGIGENSPIIREKTLKFLSPIFRFQLDHVLNSQNGKYSDGVISKTSSEVFDNAATVLVIATDEEAMICQECLSLGVFVRWLPNDERIEI